MKLRWCIKHRCQLSKSGHYTQNPSSRAASHRIESFARAGGGRTNPQRPGSRLTCPTQSLDIAGAGGRQFFPHGITPSNGHGGGRNTRQNCHTPPPTTTEVSGFVLASARPRVGQGSERVGFKSRTASRRHARLCSAKLESLHSVFRSSRRWRFGGQPEFARWSVTSKQRECAGECIEAY